MPRDPARPRCPCVPLSVRDAPGHLGQGGGVDPPRLQRRCDHTECGSFSPAQCPSMVLEDVVPLVSLLMEVTPRAALGRDAGGQRKRAALANARCSCRCIKSYGRKAAQRVTPAPSALHVCGNVSWRSVCSPKPFWTEEGDGAALALLTSYLKTFGTARFRQSGRIFFNKS